MGHRPESYKGKFLISEANMSDPNFFQTVVLMVEHNADGAFGIVVNRRSKLTLSDILQGFESPLGQSCPIYVGGPVQQEYLFALHSELPDKSESEHRTSPVKGVYFEPAFRRLEQFFVPESWEQIPADDRPKIHLFLGYSGWAPGQLEREMERGSWITHPASAKIVFHENPEEGWKNALRDKGGIYRVFADTNPEPGLN